jgi:hypothetical protein
VPRPKKLKTLPGIENREGVASQLGVNTVGAAPETSLPIQIDVITPEMEEILLKMPPEALLAMAAQGRPGIIDDASSFFAFYELIHGNQPPKHVREWVNGIYEAEAEGYEGVELWGFRGSWKSTSISVTFTAFKIGHHPDKSSIVVCANDDSSDKITSAVATMIESNPRYKVIFPNVVPDKARGWGAEGYWVRDTRYDEGAWVQKMSKRIDPSLVGGGYKSSRLIGKHPTLLLLLDDIHDEDNSTSARQRAEVVRIIAKTILPQRVRDDNGNMITSTIAIGTPWDVDDAYHYIKDTGSFKFMKTPLMVKGDEGDLFVDGVNKEGIHYPDIEGFWKVTWPSKYSAKAIVSERSTAGYRGFYQMYLLDLETKKNSGLKYYTYPHQDIDLTLPMWGGADMAQVLRKERIDNPGRDYFSMGYGVLNHREQLIVVDGILEQCTQLQVDTHLKKPQAMFKGYNYTLMEGDGVGEPMFVAIMMRNPGLKLRMLKTGGKSKQYRQEKQMGPLLEGARILISDADTPYLNALRRALDDFPDGNNDIRDGLYWLCRAVPAVWRAQEDVDGEPVALSQKVRLPNPAFAFGRR